MTSENHDAERDRAAQAFTEAFRAADDQRFEPLDPADLAARATDTSASAHPDAPHGRRRWLAPAIAAVVVLVLAIPLAGVVAQRYLGGGSATSAGEAAPANAPAPGQDAAGSGSAEDRTAEVQPGATRTEALADGVTVEVPAEWGRATAPWSDWCVEGRDFPDAPYVGDPPAAVRAIACPSPIASDRLATHLTWVEAGQPTEVYGLPGGWSRLERTVGGLTLVVVAPDADAALAASLLDSARAG